MRTSPVKSVIDHLRRAVLPTGGGLGDGELLGRFIQSRDESAFSALVNRHGPMVWGVCRRLLHQHDAEDAFQATFLVLARKAASIRSRATMGNWLYGVAHQTALQARRSIARRMAREVQVTTMPDAEAVEELADLQPVLDQELSRLPDIYRAVVVLCDLEGRTRKEVARQLAVPEGTVGGRLARARAMLAKRLTQRGVTFSGSLSAVLAVGQWSSASPTLVASTIKTACLLAAGQAAGVLSAKVAALTEGVVKAMLLTKLKTGLSIALVLGILATGATVLTYRTAAGQNGKEQVNQKGGKQTVKPHKEEVKEPFTAWGKEFGGLQAGLGYLPGEKRIYIPGDTATLVVRVHNVSKEEKKFQYLHQFFTEIPPTLTDPQGNSVRLWAVTTFGLHIPIDVTLAPGKVVELHRWKAEIKPESEKGAEKPNFSTLFGSGKFQVQYEKVIGNSSSGVLNNHDPNLTRLATGKLEVEVKEDNEKTPPVEKDLGDIKPPGGIPLPLGKAGSKKIEGEELNKVRKRLESAPQNDLEQWMIELERILDTKLNDGLPSPRQACRTYFAIHMSVAFNDLSWDSRAAEKLYQRACSMPAKDAKAWKEAFESVLERKIGISEVDPNKNDFEELPGGPGWAVPLVLIPVDALHEGNQYSPERGKIYLARLKQLKKDDIAYWKDKIDRYGGTELDAAMNIVLLDGFFNKEIFQRNRLKEDLKSQNTNKPAIEDELSKPQAVVTIKNVTIDQVDEKGESISVSMGTGEKQTKLVNLPIDAATRVVASHIEPGVANNLPFSWDYVKRLQNKVVSLRLRVKNDGFVVESIASGND